jgi:Fur family peroxide stress response transcriptional regulator
MKHSNQRDTILENVLERTDHPTADMVYEEVRKKLPNISLGTVYRNLNMLVELGQIRKIIMPVVSDRFDKTLENHYHLYCKNCNSIHDVMLPNITDIDMIVEKDTGYKNVSHDIVFTGICKKCQKEG